MESSVLLFYVLAALILISAVGVISAANAIYSALCLVTTMFGVAGVFLNLGAPFIGAVQVIVYAGAVVVLFVMIVMLLDLKKKERPLQSRSVSSGIKVAIPALLVGIVVAAAQMSIDFATQEGAAQSGGFLVSTKELAQLLLSKYLFAFEAISLLILVVIVGAISLARSPGGTHVGPQ